VQRQDRLSASPLAMSEAKRWVPALGLLPDRWGSAQTFIFTVSSANDFIQSLSVIKQKFADEM